MKLLMIEPGFNKLYTLFAQELSKQGVEVHYLAPLHVKHETLKGVNVHYLPTANFVSRILHLPTYLLLRHISKKAKKYYAEFPETPLYRGLEELTKKINPTHILVNPAEFLYALQAAKVAKKLGIPLIVQSEMHTKPKRKLDSFISIFHRHLIKRIQKQSLKFYSWTINGQKFWKKNKLKAALLPAGISKKLFPTKKRTIKKTKFLVAARLVEYKDHATIIQALSKLEGNWSCTFLGKGILRDYLKELVKTQGLKSKITFVDAVPYEKMSEIYHSHSCLILASKAEAIGMVVPEAMATGMPAIVADTGGPSTYVKNGETGFHFRTRDAINLRMCLEKVLEKKTRDKMGSAAAKHMKAFTWEKIAKQFLEDLK